MTVQVDSQTATDQNIWYIDMWCFNNSIKKRDDIWNTSTHMLSHPYKYKISKIKLNKKKHYSVINNPGDLTQYSHILRLCAI